jgi:hypothetical protein
MARKKTEVAVSKPKKEYKLDLFKVLGAVDTKSKDFYNNLTDEEKKSVPFVPMLRMISTASDQSGLHDYHILMANEILNQGFWEYTKHPELLWQLFCVVGYGKKQYHQYIKMKRESTTPKIDNLLLKKHFNASDEELNLSKLLMNKENLEELAKGYGLGDSEIRELCDEFDKIKQKVE